MATAERPQATGPGPVVLGYDGSPAAERALREAGALLAPHLALVVVVWEAGAAFELMEATLRTTPAPIDVRAALDFEDARYEQARRLAQQGAALACEAGLLAEGLAVADTLTVADTLVRIAGELAAAAVVVGAHGHGVIRELALGSTAKEVLHRAPCPVVVVRGPKD
jgi:nucleotide-binding universal stress UspA family protein